jgi:hypothetical protein
MLEQFYNTVGSTLRFASKVFETRKWCILNGYITVETHKQWWKINGIKPSGSHCFLSIHVVCNFLHKMQRKRSWSIGVLLNKLALKEGESCHQMAKGRASTAHPCMCPWYLTCCKAPLPLHLPLWTAPVPKPKPQIPHTCTTAIQTLLKPPPLPIHVLTVYSVLTIAHPPYAGNHCMNTTM